LSFSETMAPAASLKLTVSESEVAFTLTDDERTQAAYIILTNPGTKGDDYIAFNVRLR
jgi:hypothetical protein